MKNLLGLLLLILLISSCGSSNVDLNNKGYNYKIVDTTHVSLNGFNSVMGYYVIIEHNNKLYSGWLNSDGTITKLDRKLKVKK